jgi:hypothetical protein
VISASPPPIEWRLWNRKETRSYQRRRWRRARDHVDLPPRNRHTRDRGHSAPPPAAGDPSERRPATVKARRAARDRRITGTPATTTIESTPPTPDWGATALQGSSSKCRLPQERAGTGSPRRCFRHISPTTASRCGGVERHDSFGNCSVVSARGFGAVDASGRWWRR